MKTVSTNRSEMLKQLRTAREVHEELVARSVERARVSLRGFHKNALVLLDKPDWSPENDPNLEDSFTGRVGTEIQVTRDRTAEFDKMIAYFEVRAGIEIEVPAEIFDKCGLLFALSNQIKTSAESIEVLVDRLTKPSEFSEELKRLCAAGLRGGILGRTCNTSKS